MKFELPLKVVLPLVLGIIASLAIAVNAELGYRRLESANRQMAMAVEMQAAVHETLALIVDAETGQRGYLLTGKEEYLTPYTAALPKFDGAFKKLRELLVGTGSAAQRDSVGRFNKLRRQEAGRTRGRDRAVPEGRPAGRAGAARHRHRQAHDGRDPRRGRRAW